MNTFSLRALALASAALLCGVSAPISLRAQTAAQQPMIGSAATLPYVLTPLGCQTITPTVATSLTIPSGNPILVALTIETQNIRIRDDGTAPTAAVGLLIPTGGPWPYTSNLAKLQMIQTASAATVTACYYR